MAKPWPKSSVWVTSYHNVVDTSGATQKMLRPDLIALLHDVLIFKAEEKKDSDEFDNAVKELESKMERWDPSLFGELPYLPCYAAAKEQFQWFIIGRDLTAYPISPRYNLSLLLHRVLVSYINYIFFNNELKFTNALTIIMTGSYLSF